MVERTDGAIWPRGYWHSWEPLVGVTYATALTKLRAWSTVITTLLYLIALVMLAYYFLVVRSGSLLTATFILLIPWAAVIGVIEWQRRRLATTMLRNLAANGKPVTERPTFVDVQFLRWKRDHSVTTDDLQNSAPRSA
jgi:ABC-type protease/lipase transport system fused ATPase/permease subunit